MSEIDYIEDQIGMERGHIALAVANLSDNKVIDELLSHPKISVNAVASTQFPAWDVANRLSRNGQTPTPKQQNALRSVLAAYRYEQQLHKAWEDYSL